jgi:hypothetical protein
VGVRKKGSKALSLAESAGCAVKGRKNKAFNKNIKKRGY